MLTEPGLGGIVASVKEGRVTFQRILTYAMNTVIKKMVKVLILAAGLILTGQAVLTPMLMVILMITGDFWLCPDDGRRAPVSVPQCLADRPADGRGRCDGSG